MSESKPVYQYHNALMSDLDQLRSQIAMYLKTGAGDEQGCALLNKAETLLRSIKEELK
jgi:hypothetical protein